MLNLLAIALPLISKMTPDEMPTDPSMLMIASRGPEIKWNRCQWRPPTGTNPRNRPLSPGENKQPENK